MFRKLVVGCGKNYVKQQGEHTLDILSGSNIDTVHDLNKDWPFKEKAFDSIVAIHVVEHLDSLLHFMNEAWRVLNVGGELYIETPLAGANTELEWADPTHKRCFTRYSFINYFTEDGIANFGYTDKAWRVIKCHVEPIFPERGLHPDVVVFRGSPIKT